MLSSICAARTSARASGWLPGPMPCVRRQSSENESAWQRRVHVREVSVVLGVQLQRQIALSGGGEVVSIGVGGMVLARVDQMKIQALRVGCRGAGDDRLVRGGDVGVCRLGEVGKEDVAPDRSA